MPCSLERAGVQVLPALRLVAAPCHRLVPKRLADQTYPKRVGATASERRYRRRRLQGSERAPRVRREPLPACGLEGAPRTGRRRHRARIGTKRACRQFAHRAGLDACPKCEDL